MPRGLHSLQKRLPEKFGKINEAKCDTDHRLSCADGHGNTGLTPYPQYALMHGNGYFTFYLYPYRITETLRDVVLVSVFSFTFQHT